ncbi:MAG: ATP-dependent Clp protease proteolytic subunit, partial [Gluconobacter oxydans]
MKMHAGSGNDMDITRMTPTRLDDEPDAPEPETREDDNKTLNSPISELEGRLFDQRKVLIFGGINDKIARDVTGRLLALAGTSDKPIDVYVNSPGGHVESGDTIHDMIRFVDSIAPINMIGTGWVASAGALIYAAGRPERRVCLPNTRFLLHQPMGGVRGPATDIDIEAREIIKMRERLNRIFAKETGQ